MTNKEAEEEPPPTPRRPSRTEDARKLAEDDAADKRAIADKLRRKMN